MKDEGTFSFAKILLLPATYDPQRENPGPLPSGRVDGGGLIAIPRAHKHQLMRAARIPAQRAPAIYGALLCALFAMSCRKDAPPDSERCAADVKPLPSRIQQGMSLAHNYQHGGSRGYGTVTSEATLEELVDLGVEWVSLTPFGFMRSLDDPTVHFIEDYPGGETDARMHAIMRQVRVAGLKIMLKPHIWIARGEWRGRIGFDDPASWSAWFDSYERWILHYADMAQRFHAEVLVVGVEFRSSQAAHESRWRGLVEKVRGRFTGKLTYSANWDDASGVPWWDAVDYIGVQFYPPLVDAANPTRAAVRAAVDSQLELLGELSKKNARPILFTEVGYRAAVGALVRPHEWPERAAAATADPLSQTLGYRAFLDAVRERAWVAGIYWWKWFTDPKTREEGPAGFSPRGKAAEAVLRAAYGGRCNGATLAPASVE